MAKICISCTKEITDPLKKLYCDHDCEKKERSRREKARYVKRITIVNCEKCKSEFRKIGNQIFCAECVVINKKEK